MFKKHLSRLSWLLIFFVVAVSVTVLKGISPTNLEVVVFKFLIFCPSLALVHLSRKVMFPYIDLKFIIFSKNNSYEMRDSAVILGVFLYYVVLTYALTQAI